MRTNFFLVTLITIVLFSGCDNSKEPIKETHIPFQTEKDGRWGLIDYEGNILVEDEFKRAPSSVINGIFCVKNSDDLYEFYTAEKKFKKIGDEYRDVSFFNEGLAPVIKENGRIIFIDTNGNIVFELTEYKNDPIKYATPFSSGGIALIITESGKFGGVNTKGKIVIEPIYKMLVLGNHEDIIIFMNDLNKFGLMNHKGNVIVEAKYSDIEYPFNKKGYTSAILNGREILIDKKGKEIIKFKEEIKIGSILNEDFIPYYDEIKDIFGYVNKKGEYLELHSNIKYPSTIINGYATYLNGDDETGMINDKGEIVIRAKYSSLIIPENFGAVLYMDSNKKWGLLSYDGKIIKKACYKDLLPWFNNDNLFVKNDDNQWIIINSKGDIIKKDLPDIYNFKVENLYPAAIESSYSDID